ncbi:MAG: hypothetical protein WBL72_22110 [Thermoguttaceae bacterium]
MTLSGPQIDEFRGLLGRLADGPMTPHESRRLNELLSADVRAQQMFVDYAILDACLEMVWTSDEGRLRETCEAGEQESVAGPLPVLIEGVSDLHAPLLARYPGGSFLFSYAAAVLIVGLGLLIGWAYQVSIPRSDRPAEVQAGSPATPAPLHAPPEMVVVGRITDMVECRWTDPKTGPIDYAHVYLGQRYALASGLMEITYKTGAKVILQGPCAYEVESRASGYLSLGRLTARVVESGEWRVEREKGGVRERIAADQQSTIRTHEPHSPLSTLHSPLFTVRTPTARVADLGTEFGVEVDRSGGSVARVYEGKVELRAVKAADGEGGKVIRLGTNESARVVVGKDRVAKVVREAGGPRDFVRQMPRRVRIKMFNTGANLKDGQRDPHWQLVARSDDPKFKPRPAVVTDSGDPRRVTNQADRSQWISGVGGGGLMPDGVTYTFRTTFDLKGMRPLTANLHGRFVADNHVRAIRLNGRPLAVPAHGHREFGFFHAFSSSRGFVDGVNVLEIDVENGDPQDNAAASMMGLLVELDGSVVAGWPEPPANVLNAKQESSRN